MPFDHLGFFLQALHRVSIDVEFNSDVSILSLSLIPFFNLIDDWLFENRRGLELLAPVSSDVDDNHVEGIEEIKLAGTWAQFF